MTAPTEPRVLITGIMCQECGLGRDEPFGGASIRLGGHWHPITLPFEASAENVRKAVDLGFCQRCGGRLLVATQPISQEDA